MFREPPAHFPESGGSRITSPRTPVDQKHGAMNTSQDSERANGATPAGPRRRLWRTRERRAAERAATHARTQQLRIEEQRACDQRDRATADVDATLSRVDGKASMLLAFALGLASAVVALAVARPRIHPAAMVAIGGAGVMLAAAAVLLLLAVRPYIPRTGGTGFVSYARAADDSDLQRLITGHGFGHLRGMSKLALSKYRTVRRAVDLVIAALVVLVAAIPIGVLTAT